MRAFIHSRSINFSDLFSWSYSTIYISTTRIIIFNSFMFASRHICLATAFILRKIIKVVLLTLNTNAAALLLSGLLDV